MYDREFERGVRDAQTEIFEMAEIAGLSVPELARKAGVSTTTAYNWRNHKVRGGSLRVLWRLCRALGVHPNILADVTGLPRPYGRGKRGA